MTKMRVHELAKELGLESKELVDILVNKKKVDIKGHMSSIEDEVAAAIRKEFGRNAAGKAGQGEKDGVAKAMRDEKKNVAKAVQDEKKDVAAQVEKDGANKTSQAGKDDAAKVAKAGKDGVKDVVQSGKSNDGKKPEEEKRQVPDTAVSADEAAESAPKKKTIMQVFRPQNSKSGRMGNRQGNKAQGQGQGQRGAKQGQQSQKSQGGGQGERRSGNGSSRPSRNSRGNRSKGPAVEMRPRIQVSVQTTAQKEAAMRQLEMERMNAEAQLQKEMAAKAAGMPKAEKTEQAGRVQGTEHVQNADFQERRRAERAQSLDGQGRGQSGERGERGGRGDGVQNAERGGRGERGQNGERGGRGQNGGRGERGQNGERGGRGERGQNGERGDRRQGGFGGDRRQDGDRQNRGNRFQGGQGGRSQGGDAQGRGGARPFDRNDRGDRQGGGRGDRSQGRPGTRRDDRDSISTPITEQQKSQRNKGKDKEKDYKKRELRDSEFENKGKKGKLNKQAAEVKKPQPKKVEVEEIKQIILPEVLTIKELADKMKIVPSVIVKKVVHAGQNRDGEPGNRL